MNFENTPIDKEFFAGFDRQKLKISHPWPREAEDRVNQLLGQVAAKELECQRLREQVRSLAQMLEDCAERLAFVSGANDEHTISHKCLKAASDVLRPNGPVERAAEGRPLEPGVSRPVDERAEAPHEPRPDRRHPP